MTSLLTALLLAITLPTTPPPTLHPLSGSEWTLAQVYTANQWITPGNRLSKPTLKFDAEVKKLQGSTGCNTFKANVNSNSEAILFKKVTILTRKACVDSALSLESDFLNILKMTTHFTRVADKLTLVAGKRQLSFVAKGTAMTQPATTSTIPLSTPLSTPLIPEALSADWQVTNLELASKPVAVYAGNNLSVQVSGNSFGFSGSVGCNQLNGRGTLGGNEAKVLVMSTRMMCPSDQMQGETAFLSILQQPVQVTLSGDTQTWSNSQGKVTLRRKAAATLKGPYTLLSINGTTPKTQSPVTIAFDGKGASGSDGCNSYNISYKIVDQHIQATSQGMSTLMACTNSQDVSVSQFLMQGPNYVVTGKTLTLKTATETWVLLAN